MAARRSEPIDATRRRLLLATAGLFGWSLTPNASAVATPKFDSDPFALGVASGEPDAQGFVLWTRLLPALHARLSPASVPVSWEVADDEGFSKVVARGETLAESAWAHSVHVEVTGLRSDRWYFYRFRAGDATSPVGRTRTLPAPGAKVSKLRLAVACCQNYEDGYYAAYRHLANDAPDAILHVGDYIYEMAIRRPLRAHASRYCYDLADYRLRHAQYKLDPDLRAAHAAAPWFAVWDDHDVENDYAADQSQHLDPPATFLLRRAAAYQAYWEHLPLRERARPRGPDAQMFRSATLGDLATLHFLDSRQYRDDQACPAKDFGGAQLLLDEQCAQRRNPARTLLGAAQEQWLGAQVGATSTRWNVIVQQLLMAGLDQKVGPHQGWWSDSWDGYPAARTRLLESLAARPTADSVVLGGDIHSFWANDLELSAKPVASEFVATSISSRGVPHDAFARMLPENPQVKFFEARFRGYLRCEVGADSWRTDMVGVDDVRRADSSARVLASFAVERGRAGVQRA